MTQDTGDYSDEEVRVGRFSANNPNRWRNIMFWVLILGIAVLAAAIVILLAYPQVYLTFVGRSASGETSMLSTNSTATMAATTAPEATKVPPMATLVPAKNAEAAVIVVTATGMPDIGVLLNDQQMTPVVGAEISWDALKKMPEWVELPCLAANAKCLYVQSSKPGQIALPPLKGQTTFIVPQGATLVFGTFSGDLVLGSGKTYSHSSGFYGALTEGTEISSLVLTDGFALLITRDFGQEEYCLRVTQAMNQKWARDNLFRPEAWSEPVCSGTITTVIDPND